MGANNERTMMNPMMQPAPITPYAAWTPGGGLQVGLAAPCMWYQETWFIVLAVILGVLLVAGCGVCFFCMFFAKRSAVNDDRDYDLRASRQRQDADFRAIQVIQAGKNMRQDRRDRRRYGYNEWDDEF